MRVLALLTTLLIGGISMTSQATTPTTKTAIFAGGCFWCMQPAFDNTPGVQQTRVGFSGGTVVNPSYEQVIRGGTGHLEAIEVTYDPAKVSYDALLDIYWQNVDPTDAEGQFADRGAHYRTSIFVADAAQRAAAEASKAAIAKKLAPAPVHTAIKDAKPFYPAEDYHQKYYEKNKIHYNAYKYGSGRVSGLKEIWGKEK